MIEIRFHGRGGQGVVTAAEILSIAAGESGKWTQAFPSFGVERRGAPIESFCRIDDAPINLRSEVYEPDILVVLDGSLLNDPEIFKGLKKTGLILANTNADFKKEGHKAICLDADSLAQEILKKPIANTAMLGMFAAVTNYVSLNALYHALTHSFSSKSAGLPDCKIEPSGFTSEILEKNKTLIQKAYDLTRRAILNNSNEVK